MTDLRFVPFAALVGLVVPGLASSDGMRQLVPDYNVAVYCQSVGLSTSSSLAAASCRRAELAAKAWLDQQGATPQVRFCAADDSGRGSYERFAVCVRNRLDRGSMGPAGASGIPPHVTDLPLVQEPRRHPSQRSPQVLPSVPERVVDSPKLAYPPDCSDPVVTPTAPEPDPRPPRPPVPCDAPQGSIDAPLRPDGSPYSLPAPQTPDSGQGLLDSMPPESAPTDPSVGESPP